MSAKINIIEINGGLQVTSVKQVSTAERLLAGGAASVVVALCASVVCSTYVVILLAGAAGAITFLVHSRQNRFELRLTHLEFASHGLIGDDLCSVRTVCTADIQWLEYEDGCGNDSSHPEGLYAAVRPRGGSVCLLPNVDAPQAAHLIDRIEERFPHIKEQLAGASSFGKSFITLGLTERH